MSFAFDITEAEFASAVLERSHQVPVLVDFWAPWCGPCRVLKPLLEKIAADYGGRFVLAKLNSDEAPEVSARFAVRSIPAVKLFIDGQVADEFVGALPEAQVRAFIVRHLPDEAEKLRRAALQLAEPAARAAALREAETLSAGRPQIRFDLAIALIEAGQPDEARQVLERIERRDRDEDWLKLHARLELAAGSTYNEDELRARIAANPADFADRDALATALAQREEWTAAFEQLLEIVRLDRGEARIGARARLVEWFPLCPDMKAVMLARRELSMLLN